MHLSTLIGQNVQINLTYRTALTLVVIKKNSMASCTADVPHENNPIIYAEWEKWNECLLLL